MTDKLTIDEMIGQRVRSLRKDRGWTLKDLSLKMGISFTFLSQLERGERTWTALLIDQVSDIFSVSTGLLMDPSIDLKRLAMVSVVLSGIKCLDDEQIAAVQHMISALKSTR